MKTETLSEPRRKNKFSSLDNVELIRPNTDINISMLYQKCASNDP